MALHLAHGASLQALHELNVLALDDSVIGAVQDQFASNRETLTATRPTVQLGDNPRTAGETVVAEPVTSYDEGGSKNGS